MTVNEIRTHQGEVLNRLEVALAKVHGIAFSTTGMEHADIMRFITELLETASVPPSRDVHEIQFLIDAWIELDDLARSSI
jgi:hypothetical protein